MQFKKLLQLKTFAAEVVFYQDDIIMHNYVDTFGPKSTIPYVAKAY